MPWGWIVVFSVVGGALFLWLIGRRNEAAVRRDWDLVLTPKAKLAYERVEGHLQDELALADVAFDEAQTVHELGSMDQALRMLDAGYNIIEHFSPSMLRLLGAMAVFSRMVVAVAPVQPLRPRDYRTTQLVGLAYLGRFLHEFLVSTAERFRLRLFILSRSFGLVTRYLWGCIQRLGRPETDQEREWRQIEALRHDLRTLTDDSLGSLEVLLVSLGAEPHEQFFAEIDDDDN